MAAVTRACNVDILLLFTSRTSKSQMSRGPRRIAEPVGRVPPRHNIRSGDCRDCPAHLSHCKTYTASLPGHLLGHGNLVTTHTQDLLLIRIFPPLSTSGGVLSCYATRIAIPLVRPRTDSPGPTSYRPQIIGRRHGGLVRSTVRSGRQSVSALRSSRPNGWLRDPLDRWIYTPIRWVRAACGIPHFETFGVSRATDGVMRP